MKKRYTFTLDPEVVEAFRKKMGKLSPAVEWMMHKKVLQMAADEKVVAEGMIRPQVHDLVGEQIHPDGQDICNGCDLPMKGCECG